MKLISIIFSFKNEEKNLNELIKRIKTTFSKIDSCKYELIFVNDCSEDKSEKILLDLQKNNPITIINMTRTFGVGPCVLAGFREAKGDAIVYMDADLQDPPEIISDLISEYEKGSEIVHTVRTKRHGESFVKMWITKIAYRIINYLSEIPLPTEAGDFKLISRTALKKILLQNEFRPYIRGLSIWVGYKQSFVKYERDPRAGGKSKFPLFSKGPITEFISGITSYSLKPLYLGVVLGFLSLIFSIILILYALYSKFSGIAAPGSTGIIITISFFSGILLFTMGIIGIYLARIFEQTKGRDQYVIKNIQKPE
jgi:glycosyltransferase involved in cell wall biosynthesis